MGEQWLPPSHSPGLRRLQPGVTEPILVRAPTPLEAAGSKSDGQAGGPSSHSMKVHFQLMIGSNKNLGHLALAEFELVSMQALTVQMETIISSMKMPRSYTFAIVSVVAHAHTIPIFVWD